MAQRWCPEVVQLIEIVGFAVLTLFGALPSGGIGEYENWVAAKVEQSSSDDVSVRLKALVDLSMKRIHISVFSGLPPLCFAQDLKREAYPSVQLMAFLAKVDPVNSASEEFISDIRSKLSLLEEQKGPGEALAAQNTEFSKVWTKLDQMLEKAVLDWLYRQDGVPDFAARTQLLSWYGQYLSRLFLLALGRPANAKLIDLWQRVWVQANSGREDLPKDLADGLNRLLFTPFDEREDRTLLPVFNSRVVPVVSGSSKCLTLEFSSKQYFWTCRTSGSSVIVSLKKYQAPTAPVSEFLLDFAMLREIDARRNGSGFTDSATDVDPRIERIRAQMVAREMRNDDSNKKPPRLVFADGATTVSRGMSS